MPGRTNPPYPPEFRDEAVKLARSSEKRLSEVAADLGIATETLRNWLKQQDIDTGKREGTTTDEREELKRLRHENKVLKEEREVLRKGGVEFIEGVRRLGHHAVVGMRKDRLLQGGMRLDQAAIRGEGVFLGGLSVPVYVAAYWLKRDSGREKRFVLATRALRPEHIVRWDKRRWRIEGFFKTAKGRFSLDRFGQGSRLGVYRYLLLSMIAYLLAHWGHLSQSHEGMPRWGVAARAILETVLPQTVIEGLLTEIEQRNALLRSHGIEVRVDGCKI